MLKRLLSQKSKRYIILLLLLSGALLYVKEHVKHDYRISRENRILEEELIKLSSYIGLLEKDNKRIIAHETELVKYREANSPDKIEGLSTIAGIIHPRILLLQASESGNQKIDYESCEYVATKFTGMAESIIKNENWSIGQKKYLLSVLMFEQTFFGSVCKDVEPPV